MIKYISTNKITKSPYTDLCCIDGILCVNIYQDVLENIILKHYLDNIIRCKIFRNFLIIDDPRISKQSLLTYIPIMIMDWTRKECEEYCDYVDDNPQKYLCGCEKEDDKIQFVLHYHCNDSYLECLRCKKRK